MSIKSCKLRLSEDSVPSHQKKAKNSTSDEHLVKQKTRRGSSGLANLQKARMRKMLRRERMKTLVNSRGSQKVQTANETNKTRTEYNPDADYFLGQRQESPAEKLIIPLRCTSLLKRLHEGEILCKQPPESIKDASTFPTFNIIQQIDGLGDRNKNPLEWTVHETFTFIKYISPLKSIAKIFRSEEVDGEALMNLTKFDLINHFHLDRIASQSLMSVFLQLRREIIKRSINI